MKETVNTYKERLDAYIGHEPYEGDKLSKELVAIHGVDILKLCEERYGY